MGLTQYGRSGTKELAKENQFHINKCVRVGPLSEVLKDSYIFSPMTVQLTEALSPEDFSTRCL